MSPLQAAWTVLALHPMSPFSLIRDTLLDLRLEAQHILAHSLQKNALTPATTTIQQQLLINFSVFLGSSTPALERFVLQAPLPAESRPEAFR